MKIIAVSGYKDSGKTTLCRAVLRELTARGLSAGYVKRTLERATAAAGTDSGSVSAEGISSVLWGEDGYRFDVPREKENSPDVYGIAANFFPRADIVILEGGKDLPLPKIWVARPNEETPDLPGIFAVYDRHRGGDGAFRYGEGEIERLVSEIIGKSDFARRGARVYIGDTELPMKDFVADFIAGGVTGMLGALKYPDGADKNGDVRVYVKRVRDE